MTLNPHPTFPATGGYVLRLHRDARPADGLLMGRVQHVASGDWSDFAAGDELIGWLIGHARQLSSQPAQPAQPGQDSGDNAN